MGERCDVCGSQHPEGAACPGPGVVAATTVMRPPDAPRATVLPPGTMLEGVYRVGECIAQGGMGGIYVAEHVGLGKRFAVKVLSAIGAPQPDLVERLRIEARAASAVEHENVVRVSHLGRTDDGSVFIVMELIQGESLRDRLVRQSIEGGPKWLPDAEALAIGEQILEGLDAAHRAGVVHRDLKPENVMLASGGGRTTVKLVDFGISKLVDPGDVRVTRTGQVFGTPLYMSPEQGRSAADVDHRTDLYAVGVIFYEMVTGTVPFDGTSAAECLIKHAIEPPPRPTLRRPDLPAAVEALILKCLAKKPEERPGTELLRAWRTAWGAPSRPALSGTLEPTTRSAEVPPRRSGRAPWLALVGVLVLGAAGLGLSSGWRALGPAPSPRREAAAVAPLRAEGSTVACPPLRSSGFAESPGWLGAAASSIVCERARVLLGGRQERVLVPAELLDLPRAPVADFPVDPYDQPGAHERALTAAKERADAHIEGKVEVTDSGFRVALRVVTAQGRKLGEGEGEGAALYRAVRAAMDPLVARGVLPKTARLDPEVSEWSRATTVDAALALTDVGFAHRHLGEWLEDECARVLSHGPALREKLYLERFACSGQLGQPGPDLSRFRLDSSTPGALLVTAQVLQMSVAGASKLSEAYERLEEARSRERSSVGRALLTGTQSSLAQVLRPERALELALLAVEANPETQEGAFCSPWTQLAAVDPTELNHAAQEAWIPWLLWSSGEAVPMSFLRRALLIGPMNFYTANSFVDASLAAGHPQDARRVALRLSGGPRAWKVGADLLLARVDGAEGRMAAASARLAHAATPEPTDAGWLGSLRVKASFEGLQLELLTGRASAWADRTARALIEDRLIWTTGDFDNRAALVALCAHVSGSLRADCFRRLDALASEGHFANDQPAAAAVLAGLEAYAGGDYRAAALAWRPAVRASDQWMQYAGNEMAETFDRIGEPDVAQRIDEVLQNGRLYNGANLAHVRQARRALSRGDSATALALARKVVHAWSVLDVPVPALAEMRRLVTRLEARGGAR